MDRFEQFLAAEIPRGIEVVDGKVDVRVARAMAWYITYKQGEAAVDELLTMAVAFDQMAPNAGDGERSAAAFVSDAVAFVRDDQMQRRVLRRILDGATVEEAVTESAA